MKIRLKHETEVEFNRFTDLCDYVDCKNLTCERCPLYQLDEKLVIVESEDC